MTKTMLIATVAAALLGAATARAQTKSDQPDRPCMGDAARLCPGVEPGGGAQLQCLKAHKEELSPACKKKVLQTKIKHMEQQEQQKEALPPGQTR